MTKEFEKLKNQYEKLRKEWTDFGESLEMIDLRNRMYHLDWGGACDYFGDYDDLPF